MVHELGHFLAARWRGLVVEQFAVWFGKPLWKRTYNGVVYSLGSIPFGGFVKLPQMAPMESIEGESDLPDRAEQLPSGVAVWTRSSSRSRGRCFRWGWRSSSR